MVFLVSLQLQLRSLSHVIRRGLVLSRGGNSHFCGLMRPQDKKCQADNPAKARFCSSCGEELPVGGHCPKCGEAVDEADKFCPECGEKLK